MTWEVWGSVRRRRSLRREESSVVSYPPYSHSFSMTIERDGKQATRIQHVSIFLAGTAFARLWSFHH